MPMHQHAAGIPCAHCAALQSMPLHAAVKSARAMSLARATQQRWLGN